MCHQPQNSLIRRQVAVDLVIAQVARTELPVALVEMEGSCWAARARAPLKTIAWTLALAVIFTPLAIRQYRRLS